MCAGACAVAGGLAAVAGALAGVTGARAFGAARDSGASAPAGLGDAAGASVLGGLSGVFGAAMGLGGAATDGAGFAGGAVGAGAAVAAVFVAASAALLSASASRSSSRSGSSMSSSAMSGSGARTSVLGGGWTERIGMRRETAEATVPVVSHSVAVSVPVWCHCVPLLSLLSPSLMSLFSLILRMAVQCCSIGRLGWLASRPLRSSTVQPRAQTAHTKTKTQRRGKCSAVQCSSASRRDHNSHPSRLPANNTSARQSSAVQSAATDGSGAAWGSGAFG